LIVKTLLRRYAFCDSAFHQQKMAAIGVYSLRTLNDNWFEDRLQPEGGTSASGPIDAKFLRKVETEIAYIGDRYDVLTRIARCRNKASYATPDDGYRERDSINKLHFQDPSKNPEFVKNPPAKPAFINTETIPEVCYEERRPVPGKAKGFGAVLDRWGPTHEQRFWNTTHEDNYGPSPAGCRNSLSGFGHAPKLNASRSDPCLLKAAGVTVLEAAHRAEGMKVGVLCGENYQPGMDPSRDTNIQRSWQYGQDPALKNISYGGKKDNLPAKDNEASLPLGAGAHAAIQAGLDSRGGKLYRSSSYITKGKGAYYGISIFNDA